MKLLDQVRAAREARRAVMAAIDDGTSDLSALARREESALDALPLARIEAVLLDISRLGEPGLTTAAREAILKRVLVALTEGGG